MEYASNAKANAGLATGIIGTALGAVASAGGLGAILGFGRSRDEGDRPVTRYEMGLIQANNSKDNEIVLLKSQQYTDRAMVGVQAQIGQQIAWNAAQGSNIAALQSQLAGITKLVVPNGNVAPGWGGVCVMPAPLPFPPPTPPASTSQTSAATTAGGGKEVEE